MNITKLKLAEAEFLQIYPMGFDDPGFQSTGKKHQMPLRLKQAQEFFAKSEFKHPETIIENMVKIISRSSMVSMFEKPKFKDYVSILPSDEKEHIAKQLKALLHGKEHGDQQKGFEGLVDALLPAKLAKWSLISIIPFYFRPQQEVFVKPTTTKNAIAHFELENLAYKPTPSWEFYCAYKEQFMIMKSHVEECLKPNNAAFSGFLMMSMK